MRSAGGGPGGGAFLLPGASSQASNQYRQADFQHPGLRPDAAGAENVHAHLNHGFTSNMLRSVLATRLRPTIDPTAP